MSYRTHVAFFVIALSAIGPSSLSAGEKVFSSGKVRDIGSRLELFVDDWLIDRMDGVRIELQKPIDAGPVLRFDQPWEGPESYYTLIFRDNDAWRMYYRAARWGGPKSERFTHICYASSADGIEWTKPNLGLHAYQGSKDNNITFIGPGAASWSCFKDTNPDVPAEERYKSIFAHVVGAGADKAIGVMVSADGLDWKWWEKLPLAKRTGLWDRLERYGTPRAAIIKGGPLDGLHVAHWDPRQQRYFAYIRNWARGDRGFSVPPDIDIPPEEYHTWANPAKNRVRAIAVQTSKDFQTWSRQQWISFDEGAPLDHLYTNAVTPYFRAPHIYFAFPMRFLPNRKVIRDWENTERGTPGTSDTVFMSSRDGLRWDRRFLEGFLRPGLDQKNWTDRNMIVSPGVVQTGPGEMSIYYISHYKRKDVHVRRGRLRLDGIASVSADYHGGEFITKPLTFSGGELTMNYSTSAAGDIRVEIQTPGGTPLEGYALEDAEYIIGDQIEGVVGWKGGTGVEALAGKTVRLRVVMKDADLFALRFRDRGAATGD